MTFKDSPAHPKNWFLKGKDKLRFDAKRHFYGESLDRALLDIEYDDKTTVMYKSNELKLDLKWNRINEENYERKMADLHFNNCIKIALTPEEKENHKKAYAMRKLDLDKLYDKIDEVEYQKRKASINKEPFVTVVKVHYEDNAPQDGFFELDYNDEFVDQLKHAGYNAPSKDLIVKEWFDTICKNIAKESGAVFPEEVGEFTHSRTGVRKVKDGDTGKTEVM